ncbi:hypothetical protein JCM6882_008289 [Rhodosporidiobolus microsporus]
MATEQLEECTVCSVETTSRCSTCSTPFCSKEHQKLLWPTHKTLCLAGGRLVCPPLSQNEVDFLEPFQDTIFETGGGRCNYLGILGIFGVWKGSWKRLMSTLSDPSSDMPEQDRTIAILAIRKLMVQQQLDAHALGMPPFRYTAWHYLGNDAITVLNDHFQPEPECPPKETWWEDAQPFLKQALVMHTLLISALYKRPKKEDLPLLRLAVERTIGEFEKLEVGAVRKKRSMKNLVSELDVPRRMAKSLDRGPEWGWASAFFGFKQTEGKKLQEEREKKAAEAAEATRGRRS